MSELDDAIAQAVGKALREELPGALHDLVDLSSSLSGPRAYSVEQTAARLDVGRDAVYELIKRGLIVPVPNLSPTRIAEREIEDFLARRDAGVLG